MVLITKSKKKRKMKTIKNKQNIESGTKRKANDDGDLDSSLAQNQYSGDTEKTKGIEQRKGKRAKLLKKKKKNIDIVNQEDSTDDIVTSANDEPFDLSKIRDIHYHVDDKHTAKRSLYLKGDAANSESIIVFNIPPFISAEGVKKILDHTVAADHDLKEVVIKRSMIKGEDMNETYRVASAVMSSEEDVEAVLRNCDDYKNVICLSSIGVDTLPTGITKYVAEYKKSVVSVEELERDVNEFFAVHDKKMREEKQRAKKMRNVPDADGWITVTKSKFKPTPQAVVVKNKDDLLKLAKNKKKVKDNLPFYTFQLKQSKVKHLQELREKFEEDKKKLALAKAARKFRPT